MPKKKRESIIYRLDSELFKEKKNEKKETQN